MPTIVASTMPVIARRSVFASPITRASLIGWVWRNVLLAIGNCAGWSRNAQSVANPRRDVFVR